MSRRGLEQGLVQAEADLEAAISAHEGPIAPPRSASEIARALVHLQILTHLRPQHPLAHPHPDVAAALRWLLPLAADLRADQGPIFRRLDATLRDHRPSFEDTGHLMAACLRRRAPAQAKAWGVYTTPDAVADLMARLALDDADPQRPIFDPAAGAGVFPLAALRRLRQLAGPARWAREGPRLARQIGGLEIDWPVWLISQLRIGIWLRDHGVELTPDSAPDLRWGDGLSAPWPDLDRAPGSLVLGNPPYGRLAAGAPEGRWVHGFAEAARAGGAGPHVKSLYNLYIAFWGRALAAAGQNGRICFITPSAWLTGPAFSGMRQQLHSRGATYLVDLRGDQIGARRSGNVLQVRPPVAVGLWAGDLPTAPPQQHQPAGDVAARLRWAASVPHRGAVPWQPTPEPASPRAPAQRSADPLIGGAPRLTEIFPWTSSGVQFKRTWTIGPDPETLRARWRALLQHPDRGAALRLTRDRDLKRRGRPVLTPEEITRLDPALADHIYAALPEGQWDLTPLGELPPDAPAPPVVPYGWRSLDLQWCLLDDRLGDCLRRPLWRQHIPGQRYLVSALTKPLGPGPSAMPCAAVPDLDHFANRGGRDVLPLWRLARGAPVPNLAPGILARLSDRWRWSVTPEDLYAYTVALLCHPGHGALDEGRLIAGGPRLPLTPDPALAAQIVELGRRLCGLLMSPAPEGGVPQTGAEEWDKVGISRAELEWAPPGTVGARSFELRGGILSIGEGRLAPISDEIIALKISGYRPMRGWLRSRLGMGRQGSPLDHGPTPGWRAAWSAPLLHLLYQVEAWAHHWPLQQRLLRAASSPI